jgi:hypothetical protein
MPYYQAFRVPKTYFRTVSAGPGKRKPRADQRLQLLVIRQRKTSQSA